MCEILNPKPHSLFVLQPHQYRPLSKPVTVGGNQQAKAEVSVAVALTARQRRRVLRLQWLLWSAMSLYFYSFTDYTTEAEMINVPHHHCHVTLQPYTPWTSHDMHFRSLDVTLFQSWNFR
jgi:predicted nucleic acid-binding Zn ribbon protein